MLRWTKRLGRGGDTIVEVLICMAILSLVLGGAFVTTHNSQQGVLNSQEHAEALKLLESQVEQLRTAAGSGVSSGVFVVSPFCMVGSNPESTTGPTAGNCVQKSDGTPAGSAQPAFSLSIQCQSSCPDSSNGWLFKAQVSWAQVTGNGRGDETMYYRLYP